MDQSEDSLAGGDAGSNVTVEKCTHLDDESDFEVIHDDSGTEAEDVETLHHQDSDSEYDSGRDIADHPDDTHWRMGWRVKCVAKL